MSKLKDFLLALDEGADASDGKYAGKWDDLKGLKEWAAEAAKGFLWAYRPEGKRCVIFEMKENGELKDSWRIIEFTTAAKGVAPALKGAVIEDVEVDLKGIMMLEAEEGKGLGIKTVKDNSYDFYDVVHEAINIKQKGFFDMADEKKKK